MNWVERHADRIQAMRDYVAVFGRCPHPLWTEAENFIQEGEEQYTIALLYSSLYGHAPDRMIISFICRLHEIYGSDAHSWTRISRKRMADTLAESIDISAAQHPERLPGIVGSVAEFIVRFGPWHNFFKKWPDSETAAGHVSREVFFMGRFSAQRLKARLFGCLVAGLPQCPPGWWYPESVVPVTYGHIRLLNRLGPLSGNRVKTKDVLQRLDYCNRFYRHLFPGHSWQVFFPFQAFLSEETGGVLVCRRVIGACKQCPLSPYCPSSETGENG